MEGTLTGSSLSVDGSSMAVRSKDADDRWKTRKQTTREWVAMKEKTEKPQETSEIVRGSRDFLVRTKNEEIRRFLEKHDNSTDLSRWDSSGCKTLSEKGRMVFLDQSDSNQTTIRASKRNNNENMKQTTPRKLSPTDNQCDEKRQILADLVPSHVKQAVDSYSSLANVDFNMDLSVSQKHYDKWARTKRVATISRSYFPDPKLLKLKLSQNPFCFSSFSSDFEQYPSDLEKDSETETTVCEYEDKSRENVPTEEVDEENSEHAHGSENSADYISLLPSKEENLSKIMDEYDEAINPDTVAVENSHMIVNDLDLSKPRFHHRRRRSSLTFTTDVLDSLRDACSTVVNFAQRNDRKLVLSRRVSRSDIFASLDEDIRKNLKLYKNCKCEHDKWDISSNGTARFEDDDPEKEYFNSDEIEERREKIIAEGSQNHSLLEDMPSQSVDSACTTPSHLRRQRCLEKIHLFKIPLSISKSTPTFSIQGNMSFDFHSRRIEKHLSRVQTRTERNLPVPRTNIHLSTETLNADSQSYANKDAGDTARPYSPATNCDKRRGSNLAISRSREPIRWRCRAQHPVMRKFFRLGVRSNGVLLRNKYGEVIDHVNLRFLAPLLLRSENFVSNKIM